MNYATIRRVSALALFAAVLIVAPAEAKRRSVAHRPMPLQFKKTVSGVVLDAVTSQPVVSLTVTIGTRTDATDAQGRFEIKEAAAAGAMRVEFSRSGYQPYVVTLGPSDSGVLTVRLNPTPTATAKLKNNTTVQLDMESLKFGYPVPFSGYRDDEFDEFCKITDSTQFTVHKNEMAKLAGPSQIVPAGSCCTGNAEKMTLTKKNGEVMEVIFMDTCQERYKTDVGARNHVTGQFEHIPISELVELVFP
jgi:hypothetical protein